VKLQYTHSRLSSLVEGATVSLKNSDVASIDTRSLRESIALELVYLIAGW
jgi:arginyl-tRNA synthetase